MAFTGADWKRFAKNGGTLAGLLGGAVWILSALFGCAANSTLVGLALQIRTAAEKTIMAFTGADWKRFAKKGGILAGLLGGAVWILSSMFGCAANSTLAGLALQIKEQRNTLAEITTTVGANSGDNWTTRLFVVCGALLGTAWVLVDRRRFHKNGKG